MNRRWIDVLMLGIPLLFRLVFKLIDRYKKPTEKKDGTSDKTE